MISARAMPRQISAASFLYGVGEPRIHPSLPAVAAYWGRTVQIFFFVLALLTMGKKHEAAPEDASVGVIKGKGNDMHLLGSPPQISSSRTDSTSEGRLRRHSKRSGSFVWLGLTF